MASLRVVKFHMQDAKFASLLIEVCPSAVCHLTLLFVEAITLPTYENTTLATPPPKGEPAPADQMYRIVESFKSEEGEGTLDLQPGDVMAISEKGEGACFLWGGGRGASLVYICDVSRVGRFVTPCVAWLLWLPCHGCFGASIPND